LFFLEVPVILVIALVAMALFSLAVWLWAMRRPADALDDSEAGAPPVVAIIRPSDLPGLAATAPDAGDDWADVLHRSLPEGSHLLLFERPGLTMREASDLEVPQAIAARPDALILWCCVHDATHGVPLPDYLADLESVLKRFTSETRASVVLPNVPDISLLAGKDTDLQQRALVQGGIQQWNAAMSAVAARFGERVRLVDLYPTSPEILTYPHGHEHLAALILNALQ
jgi:hypothetical protein